MVLREVDGVLETVVDVTDDFLLDPVADVEPRRDRVRSLG